MGELTAYPPIELGRDAIPPRSGLYAKAPRGTGTVLVEGMTSLVMGLAEEHNLPTGAMIGRVLGPAIVQLRGVSIEPADLLRRGGAAIGVGAEARAWVAATSTATGIDTMGQTMLSWAPVVPPTHVVNAHVRHCPDCLSDFGRERPYEPLIWGLSLVTACPVHGRLLEDACPACGKTQRPLAYRSLSGLCRSCRSWLGQARPARIPTEWERWTSSAIADLVARPPANASQESVIEALGQAVRSRGLGRAGFAEAAGVSKSGLSWWLRGQLRPSIESVLRICATGGWSVRDFLLGTITPLECPPIATHIVPSPWAGRRSRDWEVLLRRFRRRLESHGEPPTFAAIARELKIDRKALREHEPKLAREAVQLREAWVANRTTVRREYAVASVVAITRELHAAGVTPSRRQVEARLDGPFTLHENDLREAWRHTKRELGLAT